MDLGNMRRLGVHHLVAFCLNDACRHTALIDVSSYPAENRSSILSAQRCVRQVRRPRQQDRRTAELERAATGREPDREGLALKTMGYHLTGRK
jgi:hypothetical protein